MPKATTFTLGGVIVPSDTGLKISDKGEIELDSPKSAKFVGTDAKGNLIDASNQSHPVPLSSSRIKESYSGDHFNVSFTGVQKTGYIITEDTTYNRFANLKLYVSEQPPMILCQIGIQSTDTWTTVWSIPDTGVYESQEEQLCFFVPKGYDIRLYVNNYADHPAKTITVKYTLFLHRLNFIYV